MNPIMSTPRVILGPLTNAFATPARCSIGVGIGQCNTCNLIWHR